MMDDHRHDDSNHHYDTDDNHDDDDDDDESSSDADDVPDVTEAYVHSVAHHNKSERTDDYDHATLATIVVGWGER